MGRLDGQVAFITGGARGQGALLATTFAREGADIIICDICEPIESVRYDLGTRDELEAVAAEVRETGRECIAEVADVRDQAALDAVVAKGLEQFGKIDIMCATAGIQGVRRFWEMPDEQWEDMIGVNLTGVWKTAKAVAPSMIERQSGCMILWASVNGREPLMDYAHYTSSKHGVLGLNKSFALELGPHNIRVNAILPGPVHTEMNDNPVNRDWAAGFKGATADDMNASIRHWHSLRGRPALPPEAIINAALWLASKDAEHVHGTEFVVDAGHLILPGFNHEPVQPEGYPRQPHQGYNPYYDED
ncbi:MAG: mycofactocin-coupled SDR family oxidoreductase [Solirubrobacterales bacterium]